MQGWAQPHTSLFFCPRIFKWIKGTRVSAIQDAIEYGFIGLCKSLIIVLSCCVDNVYTVYYQKNKVNILKLMKNSEPSIKPAPFLPLYQSVFLLLGSGVCLSVPSCGSFRLTPGICLSCFLPYSWRHGLSLNSELVGMSSLTLASAF